MAFKNLEQRFNERVNDLYAGAKLKFDGGRTSNGINDAPLMVVGPGESRRGIEQEGRGVPFVSSPRDVSRLTKFSLSSRGIIFLAKQQLLQTGNTFEQTRLINPAFVVGNAVPFLRIRRHLKPFIGPGGNLFGRTDTSYQNVRKIGQLQKGTYNSFTNKDGPVLKFLKRWVSPITNTISAFAAKKNVGDDFGYDENGWKKTRPELGISPSQYINSLYLVRGPNQPTDTGGNRLINFAKSLWEASSTSAQGEFKFGGKVNVGISKFGPVAKSSGNWDGKYTTYLTGSDQSETPSISRSETDYNADSRLRPKVGGIEDGSVLRRDKISEKGKEPDSPSSRNDRPLEVQAQIEKYNTDLSDFFNEAGGGIEEITIGDPRGSFTTSQPFLKYFIGDAESIRTRSQETSGSLNARELAEFATDSEGNRRKISYIRDPLNTNSETEGNVLDLYKNLKTVFNDGSGGEDDPITVSFAMGKDAHVQFRAFITDLAQSASPEYKPYQYIGRIEKFISYVTVQRTISFKLKVLAFSKEELKNVWTRINYLNAFVFPYGFDKGILQPNIIRATIGNVYKDQPMYITSMNINFSDYSWDIDSNVPIAADIDIQATLIEKDTSFANKPFFGIVEDITSIPSPPAAITPNEPDLFIPEF